MYWLYSYKLDVSWFFTCILPHVLLWLTCLLLGLSQGWPPWILNWYMSGWTCIWPDPTCCICVSELKVVLVLFRFFMITYVNPELVNCLLISIENFDIWWLIGFYFCTIGLLKWSHYRHACLRLVLNEVLRCKPGSLIIMAPDCRSLSKTYLVFLDMVSYNMFDQLWKKSQIAP